MSVKWESLLGSWAATYATGKSVDWDTVDEYIPGGGSFGDDTRDALGVWAVMVDGYWTSLLAFRDIASPAPVPEWMRTSTTASAWRRTECSGVSRYPPEDSGARSPLGAK